jgi:hypothetical protein
MSRALHVSFLEDDTKVCDVTNLTASWTLVACLALRTHCTTVAIFAGETLFSGRPLQPVVACDALGTHSPWNAAFSCD